MANIQPKPSRTPGWGDQTALTQQLNSILANPQISGIQELFNNTVHNGNNNSVENPSVNNTAPRTMIPPPNTHEIVTEAPFYTELTSQQRQEGRKALYDAFIDENIEDPIELKYLKDYGGETIFLSKTEDCLCISSKDRWSKNLWTLTIDSQGNSDFKLNFGTEEASVTIHNEESIVKLENCTEMMSQDFNIKQSSSYQTKEKENTFGVEYNDGNPCFMPYEKLFRANYAITALCIEKKDQIVNELNGETLTSQVFNHILNFLNTIANETNTTTLFDLWNPVVASQDSLFKLSITKESSGRIQLQSEKHSSGRHCHGYAERTATIQWKPNSDHIQIILKKSNSAYRDQQSTGEKIYNITTGETGIALTLAESKQTSDYLGDKQSTSTTEQSTEDARADMDFLTQCLITISDLVQHPNTYLLDNTERRNERVYRFVDRKPISPKELAKIRTDSQQGKACWGRSLLDQYPWHSLIENTKNKQLM